MVSAYAGGFDKDLLRIFNVLSTFEKEMVLKVRKTAFGGHFSKNAFKCAKTQF